MGVSWSLLYVRYQNFPIFYIHCQLKKDMCLSKLNSAIRRPSLHFDNAFISKAKAGSEWVPCPLERVKTIIHHLRVFDVGAMMLTFGREIAQWGRNRIFSKISLTTKSESITIFLACCVGGHFASGELLAGCNFHVKKRSEDKWQFGMSVAIWTLQMTKSIVGTGLHQQLV